MVRILVKLFALFYWIRWYCVIRPYRILTSYFSKIQYLELDFENCETMRFSGRLIKNFFISDASIYVSAWTHNSSVHYSHNFDGGEFSILIKKYTNYPDGDKIKVSKVKRFNLLKTKTVEIDEEILKRINYRDITGITIKQPFRKPLIFAPHWHSYSKKHQYELDLINVSQSNYLEKNEFITCKKSFKYKKLIDVHGDYLTVFFSSDKKFLAKSKKEITENIKSKDWRLK